MKTLLIGIGAAGNKAVMTAINMGVVEVEDTIIINSTTKDFPKDYKGKTIYLTDAEATTCASFRFDSNFVKIIEYKTTSFKDYEQECTPTLDAPLLRHMIQEPTKS